MQIIQMQRDHWNFFCPVTGKPVYGEDGVPETPAFRGGWCQEVPEHPIFLSKDLAALWKTYRKDCLKHDDIIDIRHFLSSVDRPEWVAFEIGTCPVDSGPMADTEWSVLDLGFEEEDAQAA